MATGSLQNIIVCIPKASQRGNSVAPCVNFGSVKTQPSMAEAYVIDPASANFFDMALEPINASSAAAVFSAGFSVVMLCFLVGRGFGEVLNLIRRG